MPVRQRRHRRLCAITALCLVLHVIILAWLARPSPSRLLGIAAEPGLMSAQLISPVTPERLARPSDKPSSAEARARSGVGAPSEPSSPTAEGGETPAATLEAGEARFPEALRATLRKGLACGSLRRDALSLQEREACREALGGLNASGRAYDAPMEPDKRAYFDQVVASRSPDGAADRGGLRLFKCSVVFGAGQRPKETQGTLRLGKTPCALPLQGSVFTPEADVQRR